MGAHRWTRCGRPIHVNILDTIKSNLVRFLLMETKPYSLYLSYSHQDHPPLILCEMKAFQLYLHVVFEIAFASFDVVGVWAGFWAFHAVDATTSHAFVFPFAPLFECRTTLTFLGMGYIHSKFGGGWRMQENTLRCSGC